MIRVHCHRSSRCAWRSEPLSDSSKHSPQAWSVAEDSRPESDRNHYEYDGQIKYDRLVACEGYCFSLAIGRGKAFLEPCTRLV